MEEIQLVSGSRTKQLFWILLTANILYIFFAYFYLSPLTAADIVKLETAKTVPATEAIIQQWKVSGKYPFAIQSIYLDYVFIVLYCGGLATACIYLSGLTGHEILRRAGKLFSFLLPAAGTCDVIENISMTQSLRGTVTQLTVALTYDMAMAKFSVVILSVLFIVVCLMFVALGRIR
jgi:ABC-type transport system involved in cytochrome c biogenesis permease subunit